MVSGFGPSSLSPTLIRSSEWFPVAKKNSKSNLPSSLCVVLANMSGMARHGVAGRNDALPHLGLCLFSLKTRQDLERVSM